MTTSAPRQDLEDAALAYERVRPEIEALNPAELAPLNVDVLGATSIVLGVADRILSYRETMAKLPEFEIRHVDNLVDYAKAAWFAYVTNLPVPEPTDTAELMNEVAELRSKLLLWAAPLAGTGLFEPAAVAKIKDGSGHRDAASDVVALVGLYRANWVRVKSMCGVTEHDLTRAAQVGPAMFALISRREHQTVASLSDGTLRMRRAWTLLDRAYSHCRRALSFLRFEEADADNLAPSLRRNSGTRPTTAEPVQSIAALGAGTTHDAPPQTAAPPVATAAIGGGAGPFMAKS